MSAPPRDVFAAAARQAIEEHDEWDSPHCFQTLHWDGGKLACHTYACIMPDIHPSDYPAMMARMAREEHEKQPDEPAYAYLIQVEAFGVPEPGPGASKDDVVRYNADRLGRTFHQRADAVETVTAWCADIHGRLWAATERRGQPGDIVERFYPPGKAPGGQMIAGLLAVAATTGALAYGLPMPLGPRANR